MREHGTKTTPVFLPADGEASWSLLPSLVFIRGMWMTFLSFFESKSEADTFYSYFNTRHENVKFTFEKEKDKLPFLEIVINNNESDLKTLLFHKKTYTGLLLNYFSFLPLVIN